MKCVLGGIRQLQSLWEEWPYALKIEWKQGSGDCFFLLKKKGMGKEGTCLIDNVPTCSASSTRNNNSTMDGIQDQGSSCFQQFRINFGFFVQQQGHDFGHDYSWLHYHKTHKLATGNHESTRTRNLHLLIHRIFCKSERAAFAHDPDPSSRHAASRHRTIGTGCKALKPPVSQDHQISEPLLAHSWMDSRCPRTTPV